MIVLLLSAVAAWLLLGSATSFSGKSKSLYVYTGQANKDAVLNALEKEALVAHPALFNVLASRLGVWERLKPGRFEILKGQSLLSIAKMLRNNRQTPVRLVINKLRTLEDLAHIIGKNFEVDSTTVLSFLNNPDSLAKFNVEVNTAMTMIIPNTYNLYWNSNAGNIFERLNEERDAFWKKNQRLEKAGQMSFTPNQVYTIASIVEEETNKNDEKGTVASVYINRFYKGMPLGADPTIKFALKDFGLKRIYYKHLQVESPFNTYKHAGLPPGPICTPSPKTIDAVLAAPKTDYYFFVAKKDFSGYHTFSQNFAEHRKNADEYQKALDELILRKQKAKEANDPAK